MYNGRFSKIVKGANFKRKIGKTKPTRQQSF